jgi:hypothetical protein
MSASMSDLIGRVRRLLKDTGGLTWSEDELGECLHQAMDDLNQAAGQSWSLAGLDEALATDLPSGLESLLVRGAAAYGLFMLTAFRADLFNFQPGVCQAYSSAGQAFLRQFQAGLAFLAQVRSSNLQTAANAPFPTLEEEQPGGWLLDDEGS